MTDAAARAQTAIFHEEGAHHHYLEYSRPITGSYFFAPSEPDLSAALGCGTPDVGDGDVDETGEHPAT